MTIQPTKEFAWVAALNLSAPFLKKSRVSIQNASFAGFLMRSIGHDAAQTRETIVREQ